MLRRLETKSQETEHDDDFFTVIGNEAKGFLNEEDEELEDQDYGRQDDDEENLEKLVFGGQDDLEEEFCTLIAPRKRKGNLLENVEKKAKWEDEDDETKSEKVPQVPAWASKVFEEDDTDDDDDDKVLFRTGNYVSTSMLIQKSQLKFLRCNDINKVFPAKGKVRVLEFLNKAQVAMVAGADLSLTLFKVHGESNLKIQTVAFEKYPVFAAQFSANGNEIIIGSTYPSLMSYNMSSGKMTKFYLKGNEGIKNTRSFIVSPDGQYIALVGSFGNIHILSAKSKQCLQMLRVEGGQIEAITFSPDGSKLYSHGEGGVVNIWNMKTFKCTFRFQDEGCSAGTTIAVSPNNKYLATGSSTGVVNVYDMSTLNASSVPAARHKLSQPKPLRAVENLVSSCTSLVFNHSSELLAMASNYAENAVKLFHTKSMTVYANFPSATENIGFPFSLGFSPNSGYLSIGNHSGHARLYRLEHYTSY